MSALDVCVTAVVNPRETLNLAVQPLNLVLYFSKVQCVPAKLKRDWWRLLHHLLIGCVERATCILRNAGFSCIHALLQEVDITAFWLQGVRKEGGGCQDLQRGVRDPARQGMHPDSGNAHQGFGQGPACQIGALIIRAASPLSN